MKKLLELNIGDNLFFSHEDVPFVIRAKENKFLIATVQYKGGVGRYTIVDTENEICGPHDRTFNPYDFAKQEDIDKCLEDLIQNKIGLSKRQGASIYKEIDLVKTLLEVKIFKFDHEESTEIVAADNAKAAIMHYFTEYQDDLSTDDICGTGGIKIEELHGEQITKKHKLLDESTGSRELISYRELAADMYKGEPVVLVAPHY